MQLRKFWEHSRNFLNSYEANVFDREHLEGASSDLARSMFQVGRKAAELERQKLQAEIQKEKSEIRRKQLEKRLKMASGGGTKGSRTKSLKKEDDDDDFLEDLVVDSDLKNPKEPRTYSNLKPGGFVTKTEDQKGRLEKRRAKMETAKDDDNDEDDDDEETEKEQLERETRELQSELRKTERAAEKARDKEEREKATQFSKRIQSGVFLKQPKAVSLVQTKKKRKSLKTE